MMITFAFLILISIAASIPKNLSAESVKRREIIDVPSLFGAAKFRSKSQSRFASTITEADQCAGDCMTIYVDYVIETTDPLPEQFHGQEFEKYCQVIKQTLDCYTNCSDSNSKKSHLKIFEMARYVCRESRVREFGTCYSRVATSMQPRCHTPTKCGTKKTAHDDHKYAVIENEQDMTEKLRTFCDYQKCEIECERAKLVEECGSDAMKAYEDLVVKSINDMLTVSEEFLQINIAMPSECKQIIDDYSRDDS